MVGWVASLFQWAISERDSWEMEFVTQQVDSLTTVGDIISGASGVALNQLRPGTQERLQQWLDAKFPQGEVIPFGVFRDF